MALDPNLEWQFEPELPSSLHRRRGRGRSVVAWLVGLGLVAVVGASATGVALHLANQPVQAIRSGADDHPSAEMIPKDDAGDDGQRSSTENAPPTAASPPPPGSSSPAQEAPEKPENSAIASKPQRPSAQILQGTLKGDRALSAATSPYFLQGTVTVPRGTTLMIEAGVQIVADPESELVIQGRLLTAGTPERPIRFRNEPPAPGRWKGIRLEGDDCEGKLRGVVIVSAETAVTVAGLRSPESTKFELDSCTLTQNGSGLRIENFAGVKVANTAVVRNRGDGISACEDDGTYEHVTLAANGGKGYVCVGKPAALFEECAVVGNQQGGIHCRTGDEPFRARWAANKCNLYSNDPFEVFCEHGGGVVLNCNYWGSVFTRELRSLGANEKKKPRSRIWDGLHPKHEKSGMVLLSDSQPEPNASAGAEAKVLAMAGGQPLSLAKFDGPRKSRRSRDGSSGDEPANVPEVPPLFASIAEQLRELLPGRKYDEAASLLEKSLTDPDLDEVSELIRGAQEDVRLLREFWQLAADKMASLKPGDPVMVAGIRGELVEYRDEQVAINVGSLKRKSALRDLRPRDLISVITKSKEPTDPDLLKKIWLFVATDRQGLPADVEHWGQLAVKAGAELKGRSIYLIPKGKWAVIPSDP